MAAGDEQDESTQSAQLRPLGELKVSSVETRGKFHILTKASADYITAFLAKRLQDKNVPFVQDSKNPAKFIINKEIVEDEEV